MVGAVDSHNKQLHFRRQIWPVVFLTLQDERVYSVYCEVETECILYNIYANLQLRSINYILQQSS
jgi:hypothetical protein